MTKEELIEKLEQQLAALKSEGEYTVQAFRVWRVSDWFGEYLIRLEPMSWSWGACRSETCRHNSHDPYSQGDTAFILCKRVGQESPYRTLYALPDGRLFVYHYESCGHYAPIAAFKLPLWIPSHA